MMRNSKEISRLLFKYLQGTLTTDEEMMLKKWEEESIENKQFLEGISKEAKPAKNSVRSRDNLEQRIFNKIKDTQQIPELQEQLTQIRPYKWKYVAAAAAVLAVIGYGAFRINTDSNSKPSYASAEKPQLISDVPAPISNYASIRLADGKTINLNDVPAGELASQGQVQLVKTGDGVIVYQSPASQTFSGIELNTLTNPQGSNVIEVILQDKSKVWLNAGSTLTYPVAFSGKERRVFISGEAYFEVAKNKSMPFRIAKEKMMVEVLGTRFNVNAYRDESSMRVTLLEGSVRVRSGDLTSILKPGEEAKVKEDVINVSSDINTDRVVAWKSGFFSFENAGLKEVMRKISRWYNIEVIYEGELPDERFGGDLRMDSKLSSVLKVLEKSGIKFRIETNRVVVSKQQN